MSTLALLFLGCGALYDGTITAVVGGGSIGPLGVFNSGDQFNWQIHAVTGSNNAVNSGIMTLHVNGQVDSQFPASLHGQLWPDGREPNLSGVYTRSNGDPATISLINNASTISWRSQSREVTADVVRRDIAVYWPGDSNKDGSFDSTDLVQVFQAGEYDDDLSGNGNWVTGDWDGDEEFDSTDLVVAFQDGRYELATALITVSVPEPSALAVWPCILFVLAIHSRRYRRTASLLPGSASRS